MIKKDETLKLKNELEKVRFSKDVIDNPNLVRILDYQLIKRKIMILLYISVLDYIINCNSTNLLKILMLLKLFMTCRLH